jgi:hypothetical protein
VFEKKWVGGWSLTIGKGSKVDLIGLLGDYFN